MKRKFILLTLVIATLIVLRITSIRIQLLRKNYKHRGKVSGTINGDSPAKATVTPLSRGPMIYGKPRQNGSLPSNLR